jgi:hydroxypyruvate reductase
LRALQPGPTAIDGNSENAGAMVDGGTAARVSARGADLAAVLAGFDTAAALEAAGDAVRTGPTGRT